MRQNAFTPHGSLAAHILGMTNIDLEGIEGIELWQNNLLKGEGATLPVQKDALGRAILMGSAQGIKDGKNIQLTLDLQLQFAVESELSLALEKTHAKSGLVIVMNADSGEILALAVEPTFDPDVPLLDPAPRRNRAMTDAFEPGSTLKAILAAAALNSGFTLEDEVWAEEGAWKVGGHTIKEAEAHEKFGWLSLEKMLQVSSNIAAGKFALQLGTERFTQTLSEFGFGKKSSLGFPGEISGRLPKLKKGDLLGLANLGFGQGCMVSALQMIQAFSVFFHEGQLITPQLLLQTPRPEPIQVMGATEAKSLLKALEKVTGEGGTAKAAAIQGFPIAGKTATAQMVNSETKTYAIQKYNASFIGGTTQTNPKVLILTLLSEPEGKYYAAQTAVPLFRRILLHAIDALSLRPHPILSQGGPLLEVADAGEDPQKHCVPDDLFPEFKLDHSLAKLKAMKAYHSFLNQQPRVSNLLSAPFLLRLKVHSEIPEMIGWSYSEALKKCHELKLACEWKGQGWVVDQKLWKGKVQLSLHDPLEQLLFSFEK